MNHTEHTAKAPSAKTGFFATLRASRRVSGDVRGSGASSHRPAFLAIPFTAALLALLAILTLSSPAPARAAGHAVLGSFANQLGEPAGHVGFGSGVAVNRSGAGGMEAGDVYVANWQNGRIEVFSPAGNFVRAFGWDVVASGQDNTGADETQTVTIPGTVTAGTFKLTLVTATGVGVMTSGSSVLQGVEGGLGSFHVGDTITQTYPTGASVGVPTSPATTVTAAGGGTVTMSAAATNGEVNDRALKGTETTGSIPYNATAADVKAALEALPGAGTVTVTGGPGASANPFSVTFSAGPLSGNDIEQMTITNSLTGGSGSVATPTNDNGGGYEICKAVSSPADSCKAGDKIANAGAIGNPEAITIDQATGNVFVADNGSATGTGKRVSVFSATGNFEGAFGQGVETGAAAFQFCTTATGCKAGTAGAAAGSFNNLLQAGMAVDPTTGDLYVGDRGTHRVDQFSFTLNGSGEVTGATFVRAFGWKVNATTPEEKLQECTTATGCQTGKEGGGAGQFPASTPNSLAVDSNGAIYAVEATGTCNATTNPCRIEKFVPSVPGGPIESTSTLETGSAACQLSWASGTATTEAPGGIAVDPSSGDIFVTRAKSATGFEVCELSSSGALLAGIPRTGALEARPASGYLQPAVGIDEHVYVNTELPFPGTGALWQRGAVYILGPVPTPPAPKILPVTGVTQTSAVLHGEVTTAEAGGECFETNYHFEYLVEGEWQAAPVPDKSIGAGGTCGTYPVEEEVENLQSGERYRVRLEASTSSPATSGEVAFTTESGPPAIIGTYPEEVTQHEATLAAQINPNGRASSYQFEWATEVEWEAHPGEYGRMTPGFTRGIGNGREIVRVRDPISGLEPAGTYHFRVVVEYASGEKVLGPDQPLETLDSCGLPAGRCFELVSPADKGAVGEAGNTLLLGADMRFQAAPGGSAIAYTMANGLPDATAGGEVLYRALRSGSGWSSSQVSSPALTPSQMRGGTSNPGRVRALNDELSCGVVVSPYQLTEDAPTSVIEAGGANLYRWDEDGSYTVITGLPVTNGATAKGIEPLETEEYAVIGMSGDCERVIFRSPYHFLGVPVAGTGEQLYEWDDGTIRNVGQVPGGGGPVVVESVGGAWSEESAPGVQAKSSGGTNYVHAVSPEASSVVFSAARQVSGLPAEIGEPAVFLRREGETGVDVSASETSTPNDGRSVYQIASWGGGATRVFFTARYGIATNGSSIGATSCANKLGQSGAGCDLYEFDLQKSEAGEAALTDLSADTADPQGAGVAGVLGASTDGTYVYFAARGRLGEAGDTYADNLKAGTYNVYLSHLDPTTGHRTVSLVAVLGEGEVSGNRSEALVSNVKNWTSEVTPDGHSLLFASQANVTGYDGGGAKMAYLYSADSGETVCLSCRLDGEPSVATSALLPLLPAKEGSNRLHPRAMLAADGDRAFFLSEDILATGAVAGVKNLYEWRRRGESGYGQVSLLATEPIGLTEPGETRNKQGLQLAGIDADGGDVYFDTTQRLTWEDHDNHFDVYDARVDGGFPEPPSPPVPCDATTEGSCQHGSVVAPAGSSPATPGFVGPGNPQAQTKPKQHRKKHTKHKKKTNKKHKKKHTSARRANSNRGAGK